MLEGKAVVQVREGLHARPAAEFVKLARRFSANLEVVRGDRSANAKSAVKLMLLGVKEADEIIIRADGQDASEALESLLKFVSSDRSDDLALRPNEASGAPASPDVAAVAMLRGVPASEGVALGPAFPFFPDALIAPRRIMAREEAASEIARVGRACLGVAAELDERGRTAIGEPENRQIIEALSEIARDPTLIERIGARVDAGLDAVSATLEAGEALGAEFAALEDEYQKARAEDIRAVARRVALALLGRSDPSLASAPAGSVVLAEELSALDLACAPLDRIAGLVCIKGGASSHVAIMARAHGVPAVLGLQIESARLGAARVAALDGATGEVILDPDEAQSERFRQFAADRAREGQALRAYANVEPRTRDGRLVEIAANLGSLKEIDAARAAGAMGVGLFRTEFLFMERRRPPSEEEQAVTYTKLATAFAPWPVIVRTLDIGGDKPAPGIDFPREDNPFLGWRGVRMCLDRPDIFKPQLRALLRAAVVGNIKIMLPMIAEAAEITAARRLIDACRAELAAEHIACGPTPVGAMIETPAAALLAGELARAAEFFSIGTNDLTQYVMAADRLNPRVAHLNRADHPAVLKAMAMTCEAARQAGIWIGICGEAAARPDLIPAFVDMGVNELSMSASSIPRAKKCVTEI